MTNVYDESRDSKSPSRTAQGYSFLGRFNGEYRWVGPNGKTQCDPYYFDWGSEGLLHVYGDAIVPSSKYDVQAIEEGCTETHENCYSEALRVETGAWGDVDDDGDADFTDIGLVVDAFKSIYIDSTLQQSDLDPEVPNKNINFADIGKAVDAFKQIAYIHDITRCP